MVLSSFVSPPFCHASFEGDNDTDRNTRHASPPTDQVLLESSGYVLQYPLQPYELINCEEAQGYVELGLRMHHLAMIMGDRVSTVTANRYLEPCSAELNFLSYFFHKV